ncbi:MAG TPA: 3-deoxy-manno-octulosonate cytidylyltransferase [Candidatus Udaeobacter sp.]|jgi:3-deoxy-manno-octulosonate cytidylyltransferase (CMP-KDO synthetase)|nr:3-deoxy-manno-octulosonate cytidylyltransferase [Candidatus Udaeobacter sp.]
MSAGVLGVIPARYAAVRFPGKPLAVLWGKPMLQHVWERARKARGIDELVIATDDERIASAARAWGAAVEMTSPECASGTDRVAEVARRHAAADVVLNLQGDEPELETEAVSRLITTMKSDPGIRMGTIAHHEPDARAMASDDVVKVTVDPEGFAIDFTRKASVAAGGAPEPLRHAGVYAFRRDFLFEFASWPRSPREIAERLEQLRALERGVRIKVVLGEEPFAGVDTPEQLAALEKRGKLS